MILLELDANSTVSELPRSCFEVGAQTLCREVAAAFECQPSLPGVIVRQDQGLWAFSRDRFHERLGRQFGRELFIRRPIGEMLPFVRCSAPIVRADMRVHEVARVAFEREESSVYEPLIVRTDSGDVSLLDVRVLLMAQTSILHNQMDELQLTQFCVDHAADAVQWIGKEGRLLYANDTTCRWLKSSSEELVGKPIHQIDPTLTSDRWERLWRLTRREGAHTFESRYRTSEGRFFPVEIRAKYLAYTGQEYLLLFVRDITRRKEQDEMRRAKEAAEASNRAKSDFLASMSHEIRTPLNGVLGMIELLQRMHLDATQQRYVSIARSSAEALLGVVNDILDFSKIEAGKLELDIDTFDLWPCVENTVELLGPRASQKGIELTCYLQPDLPGRVLGDGGRLRQILMNLVSNAVKFTDKGEVAVDVRLEQDLGEQVLVRFTVRDTGIGIPADRMDRLFKTFSQVDSSDTRKYGGTGLGLAIAKRLTELMGGQIGVESRQGQGATFWFTVKLKRLSAQAAPADAARAAGPRGALRVLVVDDNSTNREILRMQLTNGGFFVETAPDAEAALKKLKEAVETSEPFALGVLDMHMPGMNGLDLARAVKTSSRLKSTALIMLSSTESLVKPSECANQGLACCLSKPVRQSQLLDAVVSAIPSAVLARSDKGSTAVAAPTPAGGHAPASVRILLAEDNQINQDVATNLLQTLGYSVDVVGNGRLAVEAVLRERYDVVLMDCQMPEMNGLEATEAIRREEARGRRLGRRVPHLLIVALTANAIKGDREKCLKAGMDDYLSKPIDIDELQAVLARIGSQLPAETAPGPAVTQNPAEGRTAPTPVRVQAPPVESTAPTAGDRRATTEPAPSGLVEDLAREGTDQPVDLRSLLRRCMGKEAFLLKMAGTFRNRVLKDARELREVFDSADAEKTAFIAHAIKGAAANLSADAVQEAACALERVARSGDLTQARALLESLQERVEACVSFIDAKLLSRAVSDTVQSHA